MLLLCVCYIRLEKSEIVHLGELPEDNSFCPHATKCLQTSKISLLLCIEALPMHYSQIV